jgi:hypothetical protein
VARAKQRFLLLWHPKSTNVIVVVGTAAVVEVDEIELLVDTLVVVGFVDGKAPYDLAKEIHNFRLAKACPVLAGSLKVLTQREFHPFGYRSSYGAKRGTPLFSLFHYATGDV